MNENELQDDLEIIDEEDTVDFYNDSPYYHHPDYPEFSGWRDMLL